MQEGFRIAVHFLDLSPTPFDSRWVHPNDGNVTPVEALQYYLNTVDMLSFTKIEDRVRTSFTVQRSNPVRHSGYASYFGNCLIIAVHASPVEVTAIRPPVFLVRPFTYQERQEEKRRYVENYEKGLPALYVPYETLAMYVNNQ